MPISERAGRIRRISHIRSLINDEFNDWADERDNLPTGDVDKPQARAVASELEKALVYVDRARAKARI